MPLLERYGVQLGVQNHYGRFVTNGVGLRRLVEPYDARQIAIVWDAAHESLEGQRARAGAGRGVVASVHGQPEERVLAAHERSRGRERRVAGLLDRGASRAGLVAAGGGGAASEAYGGVVCLTAEYTDEEAVDRLIAADIAFARGLFAWRERGYGTKCVWR